MSEFESLKNQILNCQVCEDRFGFRPHPIVFGRKNSKVFQVSQAPSYNVHLTRKPFDDFSGKRLREWYGINEDIFYNEDNFYITALAHCFPGKSENGGDKIPTSECAKKWLLQELNLVDNKIYVVIGRQAAKFLFPKSGYEDLIFNNTYLNNKLAIVLPHPSPLNNT